MTPNTPRNLLEAFLKTIEKDIIPLTSKAVLKGCKVFGAAILRKSDLGLIVAATNDEVVSPLLHGEINVIQQFYGLPSRNRPDSKDCIFLATHEPCSLCLSGITWGGFDNHYYLFSYQETRDTFSIPYDIEILEEVYKVPAVNESTEEYSLRPLYNRTNKFWTVRSVDQLVESLVDEVEKVEMRRRVEEVKMRYNALSEVYQGSKGAQGIPLA